MRAKEVLRITRLAGTLSAKVDRAYAAKEKGRMAERKLEAGVKLTKALADLDADEALGTISKNEAELLRHKAHKAFRSATLGDEE